MSWIESFPEGTSTGKNRVYIFFADLDGHLNDAGISKTIKALETKCSKVVVLGTFPRGLCYD
jgi:prephenate dehydratase